jgi:hypothetical protein
MMPFGYVSQELIASIVRLKGIGELGTTLAITSNVDSYKSHTASHLRRRHSSKSPPFKPEILDSINRLGSLAETQCVSCEVRTEILYPRRLRSS